MNEKPLDTKPLTPQSLTAGIVPNPDLVRLAGEIGKAQDTQVTPEQKLSKQQILDNMSLEMVGSLDWDDIKTLTSDLMERLKKNQDEVHAGVANGLAFGFIMTILKVLAPVLGIMSVSGIINKKGIVRKANISVRPELLDVSTLMEYVRRFPESEPEVKADIIAHGYTDEDVEALFALKNRLPGGNEILGYAAHNSYNDAFAAKYGLDTGLQDMLYTVKPALEAAGSTKESFKLGWRAHWSLPFGEMLFDMRRRKIIDETTLRDMLAAHNYPPVVIEWLIKASDVHPSRLDLRKMYHTGLINTQKELAAEYTKLGYNIDDAGRLAALADLTKHEGGNIPGHVKELGKDDIISAYMDGSISKGDAIIYLVQIGFEADIVEFYISHADFKVHQEATKIMLNAYKKAYNGGIFSNHDLLVKLNMLNLPAVYIDAITTAWKLEKVQKHERPSKAEILSFYNSGVIDEATTKKELSTIGYSDQYITWFMDALKASQTKKATAPHVTGH